MSSIRQSGVRHSLLAASTVVLGAGLLAATSASAADTEHLYRQSMQHLSSKTLSRQLQLDSGAMMQARFVAPTVRGTKTVRLQQTWKGVPVYGGSIAVEKDSSGRIIRATGTISRQLTADLDSVVPKLAATQALNILRSSVRTRLRTSTATLTATDLPNAQTELYVYPQQTGSARLVYLASFMEYGNRPARPTAIIDANSGEIIKAWNGLTTANGTGPGGNAKTGQYNYGSGGVPYLDITKSGSTCSMANSYVRTYNMNHATSGSGTLWTFPCYESSGDSINGGYSPINDAHFFGGLVHDMYQSWFGSPPLNQILYMRVHYGSNYENAFWDGSSMTFGDGASYFYPLVALDVTGHEISHGFTEQNSGLAYTGQSGGMNESFSDMAGEAVEYFYHGSNDWVVGVDITKGNAPLRWMCTPSNDGGSIDSALDYYSGLDVHYSSGVYNKAFCTLAKTSGWNTHKAFEVFYRANALYWSANATFDSGACGVESSAADLGYSTSDVAAAFAAVDVDCPGSNNGGPGNNEGGVLTKGQPVTVSGVSSGNFSGDYTVDVPAGATNLKISITGGTGDADLYVRFGAAPTENSYDCRPYVNGSVEQCTEANPQAGTWHVKLRAYQSFDNVQLVATWDTAGGGNPDPGGALSNGVPVSVGQVASGTFSGDYSVAIPAGASNLKISISGGSGDADLYTRFGAAPTTSTYDCRPYRSGNSETCTVASPQAGTYHVKLRAYQTFDNVQLVATWDSGGGDGGNSGNGSYANTTNIAIPDKGTAYSPIAVSGEGSSGPSSLKVHVRVVHSYRGDLRITIVAPSGASAVLKEADYYDGADNVDTTYTVNASSVNPNGTWKLKVEDMYGGYTGYIDSFELQF